MLKRTFDFTMSTIGLLVALPIFMIVAIWIKTDSPGPVFYRGRRTGRLNKPFYIFKFRSMASDAEQTGGPTVNYTDPRVTRSGVFIRRFKLDELPQLINVFLGDMSLVGPRPEVEMWTSQYAGELLDIFTVRPGITDWATIWNADQGAALAGAHDADRAFKLLIQPTKLRLQLRYVRERTFWTDLRIIFYTLWRIARPAFYPAELRDIPQLKHGIGATVN